MYDELTLFMAHRAAFRNRASIVLSETCGCFHCCKTFPPTEIKAWADKGETALCPYCGMDSILGDASGFTLNNTFLTAMKTRFFLHS